MLESKPKHFELKVAAVQQHGLQKALEIDSMLLSPKGMRGNLAGTGLTFLQMSSNEPVLKWTGTHSTRQPNGQAGPRSSFLLLFEALPLVRRAETILLDFVQQGFVANLQVACRGLSVPPGLLQGLRNRRRFRATLQIPHHELEPAACGSLFPGRRYRSCGLPGNQLADDCLLVTQNQVALDRVLEFAKVAGPGMTGERLHESGRDG